MQVVTHVVGRPGRLVEEDNTCSGGPPLSELIGIGIRLNMTHCGEVCPMYDPGVQVNFVKLGGLFSERRGVVPSM